MSNKITLTLDRTLYKQLKNISKKQNYLSVQEYVRDVLRDRLQSPEIVKVGKDLQKRLKRLVS